MSGISPFPVLTNTMTGATSISMGLPEHSRSWRALSVPAKLFIALIVISGLSTLIYGGIHQSSENIAEFICYTGIAILASRLKVNLPGITGTFQMVAAFLRRNHGVYQGLVRQRVDQRGYGRPAAGRRGRPS